MTEPFAVLLADTQTEWGTSRYAEYERCPRAHHLKYVQGIEPKRSAEYFAVGRLLHAGMAASALGHDWRELLSYASEQGAHENIVYEAERLLAAYFAHWGHDRAAGFDSRYDIVSTEWAREALIGGVQRSARADLVLRCRGATIVVDHKTRSRKIPDDAQEYERELRTRPQLLRLARLWQSADGTPALVMLNEIVKTKIPQFGRTIVHFSRAAVDRWERESPIIPTPLDDPCWMAFGSCAPAIGSRCWAFDWCHGTEEQREMYYMQRSTSNG